MIVIGSDSDGVTQVSVQALMGYHLAGEKLQEVRIHGSDSADVVCDFIFENNRGYRASGFSIGYGGEGPHGLWTAIRTFYPDKMSPDFWKTPIPIMTPGEWRWYPDGGFCRPEMG